MVKPSSDALPELGYLHRGYEKLAENCTYHEFIPHTDRLDYISPLSNNTAYTLAVEKLLGIEAPPRAQYIRTIISELARISSHLLFLGSLAMDVGALTVWMWSFREREKLYDIFENSGGSPVYHKLYADRRSCTGFDLRKSAAMIQEFITCVFTETWRTARNC